MVRGHFALVLSLAVVMAGACSPFGSDQLELTVTVVQPFLAPDDPAIFEVTAVNRGIGRVTWGPGSSTCQLHLLVRVDEEDVGAAVDRACSLLPVTHSLDPGQARSEIIPWEGRILSSTGIVALEPGVYEVRAVARPVATSDPVSITVVDSL